MRIWKNELFKVVTRPVFAFLFVLLIACNALLISTASPGEFSKSAYKQVQADLQGMEGGQKTQFILDREEELSLLTGLHDGTLTQEGILETGEVTREELQRIVGQGRTGEAFAYTGDLFSEYFLFHELSKSAGAVEDYPGYLQGILSGAESSDTVSIFGAQDTFSLRNAQKTEQAFRPLLGRELRYTNSVAFNTALGFQATDVLLVLLVFAAAICLVTFEKESRMFTLIKPTKYGRYAFLGAKTGVLLVLAAVSVGLLYAGNFMVTGLQYGFADLSVPVQSVYGFDGCALPLSAGQYIALTLISKLAVSFCAGLFVLYAAVSSKSPAMVYLKTILLFAAELALYAFVPGSSAFQALKYVNLCYFLRVTPVYQYYFNLNVFGFPLSITAAFAGAVLLAAAGLTAAALHRFAAKELSSGPSQAFGWRAGSRQRVHTSVFFHEAYKILITNKALVFLLLLALFQGYAISQQSSYLRLDEFYYKQYMSALAGPVTEQKRETVRSEEARFAEQDGILEQAGQQRAQGLIGEAEFQQIETLVQQQTKGRAGFERAVQRLGYVEDYNSESSAAQASLVYETGWEELAGKGAQGYDGDITSALLLLLWMIAALPPVFSGEFTTGMHAIITCCKNGRTKAVRAKLLLCTGLTTLAFLLSHAAQFAGVWAKYGLSTPGALLCSIPSLAGFPLNLRLWQYLLLTGVVQYLTALAVLIFILAVSLWLKNAVQSMLLLSPVFLIPAGLHLLGIHAVDCFSLNAFLSGNQLLCGAEQSPLWLLLLLVPAGIAALSGAKIWRVYRE